MKPIKFLREKKEAPSFESIHISLSNLYFLSTIKMIEKFRLIALIYSIK